MDLKLKHKHFLLYLNLVCSVYNLIAPVHHLCPSQLPLESHSFQLDLKEQNALPSSGEQSYDFFLSLCLLALENDTHFSEYNVFFKALKLPRVPPCSFFFFFSFVMFPLAALLPAYGSTSPPSPIQRFDLISKQSVEPSARVTLFPPPLALSLSSPQSYTAAHLSSS